MKTASSLWLCTGVLLASAPFALTGINACNPCPDADDDGICDPDDACPGSDDALDQDGDGLPDACDSCPDDSMNDGDGDGLCDGSGLLNVAGLPAELAILQRNSSNVAPVMVTGKVADSSISSVVLSVTANGASAQTVEAQPGSDGSFSLSVSLTAGLVDYDLTLSTRVSGQLIPVAVRGDVAAGDLILVQGQSNAVAGDYYAEGTANAMQSHWIRSFGSSSTDPATVAADLSWGMADGQGYNSHAAVGIWALRLGSRILSETSVPTGILNGAVGGTAISQHLRNDADPQDLNTIYGRFLYRAIRGGFTNNARYLVWYQGESDGYGWGSSSTAASYENTFDGLQQDWRADFSGLEHFYVFQVRNGCGFDHPGDASLVAAYVDSAGNTLGASTLDFWTYPEWSRYGVSGTIPSGTAYILYYYYPYATGIVDFDDASTMGADGLERMVNTSLETGTSFPDGWGYLKDGSSTYSWLSGVAHSGSRSMALQSVDSYVLLYQYVAVTPGESYQSGIWARREYTDTWYDVREALRQLGDNYSDLTVMSTNGAPAHDGCHFLTEGYVALGDRIANLVLRDFYDLDSSNAVLPPEVVSVTRSSATELRLGVANADGLVLEPGVEQNFRLPGAYVTGARLEGSSTLVLSLSGSTSASTLSYSDKAGESADILNASGVGMLSFNDMPISNP